ncbi:hypothetical protein CHCC15075_1704 [Bacillus licheniformis]|nr:hypothetical protein CHCC16874_1869 [Bacillus licheniformis]TWM26240.1 hypothetical protein CHCC15075_1704 [Bacillus licheniformis]
MFQPYSPKGLSRFACSKIEENIDEHICFNVRMNGIYDLKRVINIKVN